MYEFIIERDKSGNISSVVRQSPDNNFLMRYTPLEEIDGIKRSVELKGMPSTAKVENIKAEDADKVMLGLLEGKSLDDLLNENVVSKYEGKYCILDHGKLVPVNLLDGTESTYEILTADVIEEHPSTPPPLPKTASQPPPLPGIPQLPTKKSKPPPPPPLQTYLRDSISEPLPLPNQRIYRVTQKQFKKGKKTESVIVRTNQDFQLIKYAFAGEDRVNVSHLHARNPSLETSIQKNILLEDIDDLLVREIFEGKVLPLEFTYEKDTLIRIEEVLKPLTDEEKIWDV